MSIAQRLKEQGIQQGIQQGMQQGMQQGIQQGMQQGMQTRNLEIARQMLEEDEPMEKIQKWTGLTEAQVKKLSP